LIKLVALSARVCKYIGIIENRQQATRDKIVLGNGKRETKDQTCVCVIGFALALAFHHEDVLSTSSS
jgi:hypothetical protein